jgi:predicted DNA binding CopG/RHH family protein
MSRLPKRIRNHLKKEAEEWDNTIAEESTEAVEEVLQKSEPFRSYRPTRQPVSIRMDPFDISMVKRIARKKGIPHTQLMAAWLHERIEQEKDVQSTDLVCTAENTGI